MPSYTEDIFSRPQKFSAMFYINPEHESRNLGLELL